MKLKKIAFVTLAAAFVFGTVMTSYAKDKLETVTGVRIEDGQAMWDDVDVDNDEKTPKYEVVLYKKTSNAKDKATKVVSKTTKEDYYDFCTTIANKGTGYYYIKVRASCSGYTTGEWSSESSTFYANSEFVSENKQVNSDSGSTSSASSQGPSGSSSNVISAWTQDSVGWWYRLPDGSFPKATWLQIGGKWYYFNEAGYMVTGWIELNNIWYYLSSDGSMVTGNYSVDGRSSYFDASGAWIHYN